MSNIFINRNRSQGAYKKEILKQKFQTTEENWNNRVGLARGGNDTFYQKSLRYHANPDLSPKHVGMGWSIMDACDAVKPNAGQMKEKYRVTETSMPLYKAYNQYESPGLSYEDRMAQIEGPGGVERNTGRMSNGFTQYQHSGGISKTDVKNQINDIATKIISAKEMKGTLMMNNGKPNGTSWKTPPLDLALNTQNGGETGQRFYSKFPIYRPRGDAPPDVKDDIQALWDTQISLQNKDDSKPRAAMDSFYRSFSTKNADNFQSAFKDGASNGHRRTGSSRQGKTLKFAGKNTLFPQRNRFNEDAESVISENRSKLQQPVFKASNLPGGTNGIAADRQSTKSKQTLTPSELQKYFSDKKAKIADDVQSRVSVAQSYKSRASNAIALAKLISENKRKEGGEEGDAVTVATSAIEALSVVAPSIIPSQAATDVLADEYKQLLDEYENIAAENQQMENEVAELKAREQLGQ